MPHDRVGGDVRSEDGWPSARIEDFRRVIGRLNGGRATLSAEQLEEELAQDQLQLPSPSTVRRWLKMVPKEREPRGTLSRVQP